MKPNLANSSGNPISKEPSQKKKKKKKASGVAQSSSPNTGKKKKNSQPDTRAHTYNPSYSEGREWRESGSRPTWAKVNEIPISSNRLHKVVCTDH
jgi:hypothetical protein